jgi:hypothetical protein
MSVAPPGTPLIRWLTAAGLVVLGSGLIAPALAGDFRAGPVEGFLDMTASYGLVYRLDDADKKYVAAGNGGRGSSADIDDGTLNYDTGLTSNMVSLAAELDAQWGPVGVFARGLGFYDYENQEDDRVHRPFDGDTKNAIGSDIELRDFYLEGDVSLAGTPVKFRVGDQVLNWGEVFFLRDGIDVINPFDFVAAFQPARQARDARRPLGMIWAAASLTETWAVEGYYQYDWEAVRTPPIGSFFSGIDLNGEGDLGFSQLQGATFSDLGTDLDSAFGLPEGTLGFDDQFLQIPELERNYPDDHGQYGASLVGITRGSNAMKIGLHYIRYHSRLPVLSGQTAGQEAIDATSEEAVDQAAARLAPIYLDQGLDPADAAAQAETTAGQLALSNYANQAGYIAEYPENIDMIGLTFSTATMRTGTLLSAEVSHHRDYPVQLALGDVFGALLSPVQFDPRYANNAIGVFGPDERIRGYTRLDRTQAAFSALQILPGRFGASQIFVGVDGAVIHFHDYPGNNEVQLQAFDGGDETSWGYRVSGVMQYTSVFGGLNLSPSLAFVHDVSGDTPAPLSSFKEDRKAFVLTLGASYINRVEASLSWTSFFDGQPANTLVDRDNVRFRISYGF